MGYKRNSGNGPVSHSLHLCGIRRPAARHIECASSKADAAQAQRPKAKTPEIFRPRGLRIRSLAVTYSGMPERHTTIGAERFHFRVRNGIGWFPLAIATRQTFWLMGRAFTRPTCRIRLVFCLSACRVRVRGSTPLASLKPRPFGHQTA